MLAAENIRVIFDEAIKAPATFDILNRVLRISPVHSTQAHLVPGLVIHEVGHALFSILSEDEINKIKKISRLLNIIDDGYQERMMCKKYPNNKKHLLEVFKHFFLNGDPSAYETDNKLVNIVNILNYNCKGFKYGHMKKYPGYVLPEDLELLRKAEQLNEHSMMKRWEFSNDLAKALRKYGEMAEDGDDLINSTKSEGKGSEGQGQGIPEEDEGQDPTDGIAGGYGESDSDALDKMLDDHEQDLNDHHTKFKHKMGSGQSFELPTGRDLLEFKPIDILEPTNEFKECVAMLSNPRNLDVMDTYKKCQVEAKKVANRIFTEFNMRARAANLAATQYKTTGALDPERAALYQVYDDIFVKTAIEPDQVNHAYTIMLDWSGSMGNSVYPLMLRIMELVYFAKSANVEVEVWLYTTGGKAPTFGSDRPIAVVRSKFFYILNTKKNVAMDLEERLKMFWVIANQVGTNCCGTKLKDCQEYTGRFDTQGTNILEGLILGHYRLSTMDAHRKTCFLLSDGCDVAGWDLFVSDGRNVGHTLGKVPKIYLNGVDVDLLHDKHTRMNATVAISTLYNSIGQKTTGIAWNTGEENLRPFSNDVIRVSSTERKAIDGYFHAENVFVKDIVKNLL